MWLSNRIENYRQRHERAQGEITGCRNLRGEEFLAGGKGFDLGR